MWLNGARHRPPSEYSCLSQGLARIGARTFAAHPTGWATRYVRRARRRAVSVPGMNAAMCGRTRQPFLRAAGGCGTGVTATSALVRITVESSCGTSARGPVASAPTSRPRPARPAPPSRPPRHRFHRARRRHHHRTPLSLLRLMASAKTRPSIPSSGRSCYPSRECTSPAPSPGRTATIRRRCHPASPRRTGSTSACVQSARRPADFATIHAAT